MKQDSFLIRESISGGFMILSIVTYVLFAAMILVGARFAGFKEFHSDSMSLNKTKALRGIAALGVILHHISQQAAFRETGNLKFFSDAGIYFVAIFFFFSGYGLIKSAMTKENYFDGYIKNRVVKTLVLPYWVNTILYVLFFILIWKKTFGVPQCITSILGLTMINDYGWFPIVLMVLYFVFYFAFRKNKTSKAGNWIVFASIVIMAAIFCIGGHFAWWAGPENWYLTDDGWSRSQYWMDFKMLWFSGEWWVNSTIAFLMGIILGQNEDKINEWLKKNYWIKLAVAVVLFVLAFRLQNFAMGKFGYWTEFDGNGPGIMNKTMTLILQEPVIITFVILLYLITMKLNFENPVSRFFGNNSLETYLMNYMGVLIFWSMIYEGTSETPVFKSGNTNLILYEVLVLSVTIILGLVYKFICKFVKKLIK